MKLYNQGMRPVPPLADGRDLWSDDETVYCYTTKGDIRVAMPRREYDKQRAVVVADAIARSKDMAIIQQQGKR